MIHAPDHIESSGVHRFILLLEQSGNKSHGDNVSLSLVQYNILAYWTTVSPNKLTRTVFIDDDTISRSFRPAFACSAELVVRLRRNDMICIYAMRQECGTRQQTSSLHIECVPDSCHPKCLLCTYNVGPIPQSTE
jgi:hypothetical protein